MPWQRQVVDTALDIDPDTGRLRFREVILTVPRQSGKTTLIMAVAIHRALGFGEPQNIVYAAQTRNDARKKLIDDQWPILSGSPFVGLARLRQANGSEAIMWANGSRHGLVANTEKSGHGSTLDLGFADEAFAQVDDRLEQAFSPAMITRPEPQQWVVSTMGTDSSVFLNRKVRNGREVVNDPTSRTAYFEWSANPDDDPADPETWWRCMPALGRTVTLDAMFAELEKFRDNMGEFRRAYCNIPTASLDDAALDLRKWAQLGDESGARVGLSRRRVALDMDPERTSVTIAAAGIRDTDGVPQTEIVDQVDPAAAVGRVVDIVQRHNLPDVVIDPASPANVFIAPLERLGITVTTPTARDMTIGCGVWCKRPLLQS
jgi:phage terminase large subunit-like protein